MWKREFKWNAPELDSSGIRAWSDERLGELFCANLNRSLQLDDPWGKYADLEPGDRIAKLFLVSADQRRVMAAECSASPRVGKQVSAFFQAVASSLEEACGEMMQSMVELNGEGFGRAIVYTDRIVLVLGSLRGGYPFPFADFGKMRNYGISSIREGLLNRERMRKLTLAAGTS